MEALLVIDVQRGMFADPANQPHDGEGLLHRIASLISEARKNGAAVVFVQHDGGEGDVLAADAPGFALHPDLQPLEAEPVIVKRFCSAFQETGLAALLAARKITEIVVCGMQTEYCIDTTCRSAFERGLKVTLVSDAHTTFDSQSLTAAAIIRHHNTILGGGFVTVKEAGRVEFGA
jgi:nicotinamidase-related amidase